MHSSIKSLHSQHISRQCGLNCELLIALAQNAHRTRSEEFLAPLNNQYKQGE